MEAAQLAQKMLDWGEKSLELALLTAEIETAVLEIGKTQNVGNVRATYSKGRKRYDYEAGAAEVDPSTVARYTVTPEPVEPLPVTNWKALCEGEGIFAPFTQREPSVKVKVVA